MYALSGRVNGNSIVVDENIAQYEGCDVVITILDRIVEHKSTEKNNQKKGVRETAAKSIAGLWKSDTDA